MISHIALAVEDFPRPLELAPDIEFWTRVYTEISTSSGFIHDSYDLSVVYQTVALVDSSRSNRRNIREVKARYATILNKLATGTRTNLSDEQARVLALWGSKVSNQRLKKAASNLRFQKGQSNRFLEGLKRSGAWRSHIEKVLADMGLPEELSALPHVESSFNPKAYSRVGASGMWQFTRATGRRFMRVDYVVDERMDPFASTLAAAKLLQHNRQLTGSWPLSLTAYNHGAASIRRATRSLGTKNISTIVRDYRGRAFGFASRNFYVAFLAALEIDRSPEKYFGTFEPEKAIPYELVKLGEFFTAKSVANALGLSSKVLRQHNPALLEPVWSGSKRMPVNYSLRVPKELLEKPVKDLLASIKMSERYSEQTPDVFHKVVRGDTISEIAARYGYRVSEVLALNRLGRRDYIRIGQVLRLPATEALLLAARVPVNNPGIVVISSGKDKTPTPIEKPALAASGISVGEQEASEASVALESADGLATAIVTILSGDPSDYTVDSKLTIEIQAAETLGHYADWLDIRASDLRRINGMSYGRPLVIGHRIKLDFSRVSVAAFEQLRLAYQQGLQQAFFMSRQINSVSNYTIRRGESLWTLSQLKFNVPVWLLRQYNPDLDFDKLKPGLVIKVPQLK